MSRIVLPLVVIAGFAALAFAFALSQAIWVDETTQLSGLTLAFGAQLDWLAGGENPIPGVPPDRMPPLSYWIGGLWAGVFGLSELSMRVFGIVAMLCGVPAVWLAARDLGRERGGPLLPAIVLALVYLAPGAIVQAGEIRAYPLYFAFSAWAAFAYLRALLHPGPRAWFLLAVFCLAAGYTHFFGVVMAGVMWLSLLILRLARGEPVLPVLVGGGATGLLFAGLLPFVLAAMNLSAEAAPRPGLAEVARDGVRLAVRLWLHGTHLSSPALMAAALAGLAALTGLALLALRRREGPAGIGLLLPLALAFVALPLLRLAIGGFDVLAPHYNLWLVPLFSLFAATALTDPRLRGPALGAAVLVVGAHLVADVRLIRHAETWSHGPGEWIAAAIADPQATIVIHDAEGNWGHAYFPVHYLTAGRATQILRDAAGRQQLISPGGLADYEGAVQDFPTRIYVRTGNLDSGDLAGRLTDPGDCGIPAMRPDPGGSVVTRSFCAFTGATMVIAQ